MQKRREAPAGKQICTAGRRVLLLAIAERSKHAVTMLRTAENRTQAMRRTRLRIHDEADREALVVLREASDRLFGRRVTSLLAPVLLGALQGHGHLLLDESVCDSDLTVNAAADGPTQSRRNEARRRAHLLRLARAGAGPLGDLPGRAPRGQPGGQHRIHIGARLLSPARHRVHAVTSFPQERSGQVGKKNGAVVRRLFVNYFQTSFRLASKTRIGAATR